MKKSAFNVTITGMLFAPHPQVLSEANYILLEANREQVWGQRRNADGVKFPKGVDLFESGDLKDEADSTFEGYEFTAPHAEYVDRRYHFAGVNDQALKAAEPKLEELFNSYSNEVLIQEDEA